MIVIDALEKALASSITGECRPYLLVDGAQSEGSDALLERWGIRFLSLFDETPESTLREIAPLLIPLADIEQMRRIDLFAWAEDFAFRAPAINILVSQYDSRRLADHLRRFHVASLSEGQSMLLRWYDTRILPVLLGCLTLEQHAAFAAGTLRWDVVDRAGSIVTLIDNPTPPLQPQAPRFGARQMALDDIQYAALVDASALDGLLRQLRRVIPDELKRIQPAALTSFVRKSLDVALAAGVTDIDRQTQVALIGLYTSGHAYDTPEFKHFMAKPPGSLDAFYDGIQALSDKVWNAGPPLWESNPGTSTGGTT